jgi:ligand-binding sensor domain-containing protein
LQVIAERRFDAASGLRASTVFAMQVDRNGIPWLGADDGLYEYAGGSWRREELPDGFENQQVRSLPLPANGSRWLGTRRGLLYQPRGGAWRVFGEADGLQGQVVFSLVETNAIDGSPRVVAGTTLGVSYFNGEKFIPLPLPAPMQKLGLVLASGFAPDGSAELWVASSMGGAARLNRGAWTYFGPPQGLASPDVQALAVSPGWRACSSSNAAVARCAGCAYPIRHATPFACRSCSRQETSLSCGWGSPMDGSSDAATGRGVRWRRVAPIGMARSRC